MSRLKEIFEGNTDGRQIHKWLHYFDIYERHFEKYVGKEVNILEIGIFHGGSLEMWKKYFGEKARIYAVDINPNCRVFEDERTKIFIGSQEDRTFLRDVKQQVPLMDIIIDDGGHTMRQQIVSYEELYSHVKSDGIYLVEDLHTSYWSRFGGGLKKKSTFIEYSKNFIDQLNSWHYKDVPHDFARVTHSLHYYDSILVLEKRLIEKPIVERVGDIQVDPSSFPYDDTRNLFEKIRDQLLGRRKE
jgi:hypothetical protein